MKKRPPSQEKKYPGDRGKTEPHTNTWTPHVSSSGSGGGGGGGRSNCRVSHLTPIVAGASAMGLGKSFPRASSK